MTEKKIRVFLDTNALFQENFFRSTTALAFLKASHLLGIEVVIPEIVIDELEGNFSRAFAEKLASYKKAYKDLEKFVSLKELELDSQEVSTAFSDALGDLLSEEEVKIAPYPDDSLKSLVVTSYRGEKPFKPDGDGYKDFLVWKSICAYIEKSKGKGVNYFITNNSKDFCAGIEDKITLHPTLAAQIKSKQAVPYVYDSVKKFFEEKLSPSLTGLKINDVAGLELKDLKDKAKKILEDELPYYSAYGFEDLPFSNDVIISSIQGEEIDSVSLKELGDNEILITILGMVDIEVDGFIEKNEYYHIREDKEDIYVIDANHNDWVMSVCSTIETPFELRLTYQKSSKEIINHTIEMLEELKPDWHN